MRTKRALLGLVVVVVGCLIVSELALFAAAPPNRKGKNRTITGVVVEVDHFKGKNGHGLIRVRHANHRPGQAGKGGKNGKGGQAAKGNGNNGGHVVTVRVNERTQFEFVSMGGKGNKGGNGGKNGAARTGKGKGQGTVKETLAHFRNVHPGMHVRIRLGQDNHAEHVSIMGSGGRQNGKGKQGKNK